MNPDYDGPLESGHADRLGYRRWGYRMRLPWKYTIVLIPLALIVIFFSLTRGYESRNVQFGGFSSTSSGVSLGNGTIFGLRGQTITVDYDVTEMPRGAFRIFIMELGWAGIGKVAEQQRIRTMGRGQIQFPVRQVGFYKVNCDGSPDGRGYDVTYTARWKVD